MLLRNRKVSRMRIGDRCFVHGYVDEIRKDTIIIRNKGGYFGTDPGEVIVVNDTAHPNWISCSEKLPENDECVLATTAWGDVTIAERVYPPINDTCWFIHDGNTNATIDNVVAWMPLPEPYRGDR